MAARIWTGIRSRAKYLQRRSVVFAVEVRLKIVTELYMREMSPKEFQKEFGGGSISRVTQNFERLAETGWLRLVYIKGPGGKRRGGKEHFYRATELAFCDQETWAMLPYSMRVTASWNAFKQIAKRLREAMEAETFDARPDRHLTSTQIVLDRAGWTRVTDAVIAEFASQYEDQEDARRRVADTGKDLIRASSILMAFESPRSGNESSGPDLMENDQEPTCPFPLRLSKVFEDPVCIQIIAAANEREMSAPEFYREYEYGSVKAVRRRFKKLVDIGWLAETGSKTGGKRRAGHEVFYKATRPAILRDKGPWAEVPDSVRGASAWATFERLTKWAKEAMVAGTFDANEDRVLSWAILALDQQGWEKVTASVGALLARILEEQELAKSRMKESGEPPIVMTVALGAFESPVEAIKEP
jgi:hypothetical protein